MLIDRIIRRMERSRSDCLFLFFFVKSVKARKKPCIAPA
jgi:hypothetical protein